MNFFQSKVSAFFNERSCKQCFDEIVFLSELIVNRILIASIVINKICSNNNNNDNNNKNSDDEDDNKISFH